jgi:hypothetical protein
MSLYQFDFTARTNSPPGAPESKPQFTPLIQLPDLTGKTQIAYDKINVGPEDVRNMLAVGFETVDNAIKTWLSDLVVPTKDGVKKVTIRVPRGDKTILVWKQDLIEGRVKLPVLSVHRNNVEFHAEKFSPPYIRMNKRFADNPGSRLVLTYRPRQFLVEYQLSYWSEFKADNEYISYQLMTRFDPLAEIHIADGFMQGNLIMKYNGCTDSSDIEAARDLQAKVRYDLSMTAEAWLPLPEKLMPSILGKVQTLQEEGGEILQAQLGVVPIEL